MCCHDAQDPFIYMRMKSRKRLSIGVVIWMGQEYGRGVLASVLEYVQARGLPEVQLFDAMTFRGNQPRPEPLGGIIAVLGHNETARLRGLPCPTVLVPHLSADSRLLSVAPDGRVTARLAADHLLSMGLRRFAVVRHTDLRALHVLQDEFRQVVTKAGATVLPSPEFFADDAAGIDWIRSLPTPCGILCERDGGASHLVKWAAAAGRRVPDDLAIMGIGNDLLLCMTHRPTLTSVVLPAAQVGWQAAQTLVRAINGKQVRSVTVPPTTIVARQSTQISAISDPIVSKAADFMRLHMDKPIDTRKTAGHVKVSRRALEYRFREAMGRSVHEELARLRVGRAISLLSSTQTSIKSVANAIGFNRAANFNRFIKQHTGHSPSAYRRIHGHRIDIG
jgi:LacI family transcriptional regulator